MTLRGTYNNFTMQKLINIDYNDVVAGKLLRLHHLQIKVWISMTRTVEIIINGHY